MPLNKNQQGIQNIPRAAKQVAFHVPIAMWFVLQSVDPVDLQLDLNMLPIKLRAGMKVVLETSAAWSNERFICDNLVWVLQK